jgi:hypothetical protein
VSSLSTKDAPLRGGVGISIIPMSLISVQSPLWSNEKGYPMISLSDAQPSQNHLTILLLSIPCPVTGTKAQLILPQSIDSVHNESFWGKLHLKTLFCDRDSLRSKIKKNDRILSSTNSFCSDEKYYK